MKSLKVPRRSKVAVVYRGNTTTASSIAKTLAAWLKERSYIPLTAPQQKLIPGTKLLTNSKSLADCALIIALGGDGTYLRAVRLLGGASVPILGINLGNLGFLTPFKVEELFHSVEETLEGKMNLIPRSMLEIKIIKNDKVIQNCVGLNDVVLERGSLSQLITLSLFANDLFVSEVIADGLIIASPTGSTAYNLAAGGPILHPNLKAFVITPIAPHSLTNRPLIVADTEKLKFKLSEKHQTTKQKAHLVVDGIKLFDITADHEVVVCKARATHLLVRHPKANYFHLLREKLKFGIRT
jgi:NAD+ kinase